MSMKVTTLTVNGQPAQPGCYVEGSWGQYGPDHLADQLEGFGIKVAKNDDPRRFRRIVDWCESKGVYWSQDHTTSPLMHVYLTAGEAQLESADDLIERANDVTEGGYWEWRDGECLLRSFDCPQCRRNAVTPGDIAPCDYCADADDPGCFA